MGLDGERLARGKDLEQVWQCMVELFRHLMAEQMLRISIDEIEQRLPSAIDHDLGGGFGMRSHQKVRLGFRTRNILPQKRCDGRTRSPGIGLNGVLHFQYLTGISAHAKVSQQCLRSYCLHGIASPVHPIFQQVVAKEILVSLLITEIFYSIQGESIWSGLPCVFVRLSGCNLRCHYCDTPYAYEPGEPLGLKKIIDRISKYNCRRLTITGGEPLLQEATPDLVTLLLETGYDVSIETNGSLDIDRLDRRCIRIMDIKCPSSGMQENNRMENLKVLSAVDQIKFVIADRGDFEFSAAIAKRLASNITADRIWFSPVSGILPADRLAAWMLESNAHGRLQLQLHKLIWPHRDRGV